jgi:hypothetical protein
MNGAIPPFPLHAFTAYTRAILSTRRLTMSSVTHDYTRGLINNELKQIVMEAVVA